ncbi:MAG: nucleoside triphosphate hydrolase [Candidatus Leucobacter sulfamidivorax]|nr:nucleoside triphosphate hydrolase [Candidatus Leucobacter sulfamidivorax]
MAADVENPIQDPLSEVRATVRRLANPGGCAWHEVQTHDSLIPFLIEETAEFVDAVERGLPPEEVAGELGDVLYQVLFHAAIAERDGEGWDLDGVAAVLDEKLIARHPHVFGDRGYMSVEELHAEWERLKEDAAGERRGSRGALDGIPAGMPTLARAAKVVERLKRAGFLEVNASRSPESCPGATAPELIDPAAAEAQPPDVDESEIGDALLALVIRANAAGIDADRALRLATARLAERTLPAPPVVPAPPAE